MIGSAPYNPTLVTLRRTVAGVSALLLFHGCSHEGDKPAPPPPAVTVTKVEQQNVPITTEWIGTLSGMINAAIKAQVSGYLISRNYEEGRPVEKNQVLFQIDPRPFKAVLNQARAEKAEAEARLGKARQDVERFTPLAARKAISQQELDDAIQAERAAEASVASAQARIVQTELNLEFTTIRSPVEGIAGIAQAQVGDLVGPATVSELTTVSQIDPIRAFFTISEQEYLHFRRQMEQQGGRNEEDPLELHLVLADGTTFSHPGHLTAADRQVDPRTGAMLMIGQFPNPNGVLRPGQFARVRAITSTLEGALLVPQRAVSELQGIHQIVVMNPDQTATIRTVTVGPRVGSEWVISEGLKPGETVIVEGFQRVRDGMKVAPSPFQPKPAAAPAGQSPATATTPKS